MIMKKLSRIKRSLMAAAISGVLMCGGVASADQAGMDAFREAMTNAPANDSRVFREQVVFFLPEVQANLDFQAISQKDSEMRIAGNFNNIMTDDKGNTKLDAVPFYVDQNKQGLTIYFRTLEDVMSSKKKVKWQKISVPQLNTAVDILGTPEGDEIQSIIALAKSAEVLRDTPNWRTMMIDIDEESLIGFIEKTCADEAKKSDKPATEAEAAIQNRVFDYIKQGIRSTDVRCTWTVNKQDWRTVTFAINLSGVIQGSAQAALNDPKGDIPFVLQPLLESLAYYGELKAYTTYLNPETKAMIELPKELNRAEEFKFNSK